MTRPALVRFRAIRLRVAGLDRALMAVFADGDMSGSDSDEARARAAHQMACQAQLAASRHLPLHYLAFRLQYQHCGRLHRDQSLAVALDINSDGQRIGLLAELVWVLYALLSIQTIGGLPRISVTSSVYSLGAAHWRGTDNYLQASPVTADSGTWSGH